MTTLYVHFNDRTYPISFFGSPFTRDNVSPIYNIYTINLLNDEGIEIAGDSHFHLIQDISIQGNGSAFFPTHRPYNIQENYFKQAIAEAVFQVEAG